MFVFLNNKFLPQNEAGIPVTDHGFLYGDGIYETILQQEGQIFNLQKHLNRLEKSAILTNLQVPDINYEKALKDLIKLNKFHKSRLRITLTRGSNNFEFSSCSNPLILITESEIRSIPNTYKAVTINLERPYPKAKTISRITENLARAEAERNNVQECLFINAKGFLTEGSVSNLFLVKRGKILMPKLHNHLPGTMQQQVLKLAQKYNIEVYEKDLKLKHLLKADEAFLTNALIGIKPLVEVNSKALNTGKITQLLAKNLWT